MSTALGHPDLVESGFANAMTYDTHRPSYPAVSVNKMLEEMKILDVPAARILEIGAGTGKLTEQLVAHERSYEIIAVEPHVQMRQVLDAKALPGVKVLNGTAANLEGIEEAWADGVVVAQAFHWYIQRYSQDTVNRRLTLFGDRFSNIEALQEMHRITKPYGTLALLWNFEDYNSGVEWKSTTKWEDSMKQLLWAHDNHRKWQTTFQEQPSPPLYSPLEGHIHQWTVWLTKEAIWDRFCTISRIAIQRGDELEETKRAVLNAMNSHDVETNSKGEIALHGRTELYWVTALPATLNCSL